ncbi:MAG TPA: LLM class flavin-dependent oxidoreductase [Mycobacteriales bacterium]|nr:LLM class flavin-dependent oxidoreductase [Mycobacteriales bacterium]
MTEPSRAMRRGSVSLRLYPHLQLPPTDIVQELLTQGRLAEQSGFDGVMVSEHHNAFAGYLPNPIQAAGWLLDVTQEAWAAPCPLLLPLRPTAMVAEEIAWLAARFPGRVGVGVAAGSLEADFTIAGTTKDDLTARFADAMRTLADMLGGRDPGLLPDDPAITRCTTDPIPVVSAAMSPAACRRAAAAGIGLLFDSLTTVARCRDLVDVYRGAGGSGPVVLIRRVAPGTPPVQRQDDQLRLYRSYASSNAIEHWGEDQLASGDAAQIAEMLAAQANAVGADCLNLRIHSAGMAPIEARTHIEALADVRSLLAQRWPTPNGGTTPGR